MDMQYFEKPSLRKQILLNKFFWLRSFLIIADQIDFPMPRSMKSETKLHVATVGTVWDAQIAYLQAEDDEYNYNVALEAYQMFESGFMSAGIDIDAGIKATMERNGYTSFSQMKPDKFVMAMADKGGKDPWAA